jgi:hypothetical protein
MRARREELSSQSTMAKNTLPFTLCAAEKLGLYPCEELEKRRKRIMSKKPKRISVEEFDRIFDEGKEDITQYLDMENAIRLGDMQEKVAITLTGFQLDDIDDEASRLNLTRQALIKKWIGEKLACIAH